MKASELKSLLDESYEKFHQSSFIEDDPVLIPHLFTKKEDIEIAGFLASTLAWGQRKQIIKSATELMHMMDDSPYEFVMQAKKNDLKPLEKFVYRTFNGKDCVYYMKAIAHCYRNFGGIENIVTSAYAEKRLIRDAFQIFREIFFQLPHENRTEKHFSDIEKNAACKRLNLYLRWMVRHDNKGIDFGIWKNIPMSALYIPLDVHTSRTARELGLLTHRQNNWTAVCELTNHLITFDKKDPVKYDFALFCLSMMK